MRNLTLLKDPIRFISQLVNDRGFYKSDTMKRVSLDEGDNSIKMIVNVCDKHHDPKISLTKREKRATCALESRGLSKWLTIILQFIICSNIQP